MKDRWKRPLKGFAIFMSIAGIIFAGGYAMWMAGAPICEEGDRKCIEEQHRNVSNYVYIGGRLLPLTQLNEHDLTKDCSECHPQW